MYIIPADSAPNDYPVYIGTGTFSQVNQLCSCAAMLVIDATVMPIFADQISELFLDSLDIVTIESGERHKTWYSIEKILNALIENHHDRATKLISVGGGMVNDISGFAASIYQRGIDWISVPTTLLAQVDAAIGGKTGFNYAGIKNAIGTFHQPKGVIIDLLSLSTLPERQYISGLAEVIKYGVIKDASFFTWLECNVELILQRCQSALQTMLEQCCIIKRSIVAHDEKDKGHRMILNFGHTFAHALEAATNFSTILHGEAVAIGMLFATSLSEKLEFAAAGLHERLYELLYRFGLPVDMNELYFSVSTLHDFMMRDKKIFNKRPSLVLPLDLGKVRVVKDFDLSIVEDFIEDYVSI